VSEPPSSTTARPDRDDLIGYQVESVGGTAGSVDETTRDTDERYLVVRTGRWPRQRRVVVPVAAINCVDSRRRQLWVERDRDAVRAAPLFEHAFEGRRRASQR
jgi:hypothetical protein